MPTISTEKYQLRETTHESVDNVPFSITFKYGEPLYEVVYEGRTVAYLQYMMLPDTIFLFGIEVVEKRQQHGRNIMKALPDLIDNPFDTPIKQLKAYSIKHEGTYLFWKSLHAEFSKDQNETFEDIFKSKDEALFTIDYQIE